MFNINCACSFPAVTIIFRNMAPLPLPLYLPYHLSQPQIFVALCETRFPVVFKGVPPSTKVLTLVTHPVDPHRSIKSSDGETALLRRTEVSTSHFYCQEISLVRSTGPRKLGRKKRGKGERMWEDVLRDTSLHHEGAACYYFDISTFEFRGSRRDYSLKRQ